MTKKSLMRCAFLATEHCAMFSSWCTYVVVQEPDLWQGEGVVEGHEDSWLHQDVNQVHGCVPKEECRSVQACILHTSQSLHLEFCNLGFGGNAGYAQILAQQHRWNGMSRHRMPHIEWSTSHRLF